MMDKYLIFLLEGDLNYEYTLLNSCSKKDVLTDLKSGFENESDFKYELKHFHKNNIVDLFNSVQQLDLLVELSDYITSAKYIPEEQYVQVIDKKKIFYKIYANGIVPETNVKVIKEIYNLICSMNDDDTIDLRLRTLYDNELFMENL